MITLLGSRRRCCDGLTRRETLKAGALSLLGGSFNLPSLLALEQGRPPQARPGKARSVILLYLLGGPATQDMWDMKPDAPEGIRSEFRPIPTRASGIRVCEHLPRMAQWMHRAALVRTVNRRDNSHNCLPSYTGYDGTMAGGRPRDTDPPSMGSVCEFLRQGRGEGPDYVYLPCYLGWGQAVRRAGPYAGFLGQRYNALTTECQPYTDPGANPRPGKPAPVRGEPALPHTALAADITLDRLNARRGLLQQFDDQLPRAEAHLSLNLFDRNRQRAFSLLTSSRVRGCFDLRREDPRLVDRYGRTLFGNSALIARRLVQQGVRFVNVTWDLFWDRVKLDFDAWDTHTHNFSILRENKLPGLDETYSALLEDLERFGLLDETLVVVMGEMGRTPRVNRSAGRDHWTSCYSVLLAGAGIRGGAAYGASDAQAAFVKDSPVSPGDICATIYACLGIDPNMPIHDRSGRPFPVAHGGKPIHEILA